MSTLKSMTESSLQHSVLKQRHRQVRDGHPTSLTLRVHRAMSWLNRAEQAEDVDGKFIFLWIAFNAAYAQELDDSDRTSDKATFTAFLQKLCDLDTSKRIDESEWKDRFASARKSAQSALVSGNTPVLLSVVFNRLYTLRNQLIHGGATWNGNVNRDQLRDCTRLLGKLVPVIIALMMDNPSALWGDAVYPVVDQDN